jgi:hypothetical protein
MKTIYRIAVTADAIAIEHWPDWAAFDAVPPARATSRADIVYAASPLAMLGATAGPHELQHIRVVNGRMADVNAHLAEDLRAWSSAGAQGIAAFTIVHGDDIPACLVLLRWPSMQAALDGQVAFEASAPGRDARRASRLARGQSAIRGTERLFRPQLTVTPRA